MELCKTCKEAYTMPPSERANLCSNSFHCCHDCIYIDGKVVQLCYNDNCINFCKKCIYSFNGVVDSFCDKHKDS